MNKPDNSLHLTLKHTFVQKSKRRISLVTLGFIMMLVGIWLMLITVQAVAQRELYCERTISATTEISCVLRLKWLGVLLSETAINLQDAVVEEPDGQYQLMLLTEDGRRPFSVAVPNPDQPQAQVRLTRRFFDQFLQALDRLSYQVCEQF